MFVAHILVLILLITSLSVISTNNSIINYYETQKLNISTSGEKTKIHTLIRGNIEQKDGHKDHLLKSRPFCRAKKILRARRL